MKKVLLVFLLLYTCSVTVAQDKIIPPRIAVKWTPSGLIFGSLNLHGEYNFGKNSLTAKLGIPLKNRHTIEYGGKDVEFAMKGISFMAGYRTYFSKKHMKGLYFEPYFKYIHHVSEGDGVCELAGQMVKMNFMNDYNGIGIGGQFGIQFLLRNKFIIDLFFLGPEINSSRNKFVVKEQTNSHWNYAQAGQAENDIREFVDKFPMVRNKVKISVNDDNKTVRADFRGILPGYRIGISFGFAF